MDNLPVDQQTQKKRQVLAVVFVALCLSLSGLLLRRQIAAHPAPLDAATHMPAGFLYPSAEPAPLLSDPAQWHADTGPIKKAIITSINTQLAAIRHGDADKAIFYQSSGLRRNFSSPQDFVHSISTHYPEFGHARSAEFGPVRVDKSGNYAQVVVTALGENGRRAQGEYMMIKEGSVYKVAAVDGGHAIQ